MLELREDAPDGVVAVAARGWVTGRDYTEVLLPAVEAQAGDLRLVYEIPREARLLTPGAIWQDMRFGARHFGRLRRLAVVSDRWWARGSTLLFRLVRPGRVRGFPTARRDEALAWSAT
ncbi:MAG: STAS/SEC14 domain-containing protein [Planctomycetota bacterium]